MKEEKLDDFIFGINKDNGRFLLRNNVKGKMGVIL